MREISEDEWLSFDVNARLLTQTDNQDLARVRVVDTKVRQNVIDGCARRHRHTKDIERFEGRFPKVDGGLDKGGDGGSESGVVVGFEDAVGAENLASPLGEGDDL